MRRSERPRSMQNLSAGTGLLYVGAFILANGMVSDVFVIAVVVVVPLRKEEARSTG